MQSSRILHFHLIYILPHTLYISFINSSLYSRYQYIYIYIYPLNTHILQVIRCFKNNSQLFNPSQECNARKVYYGCVYSAHIMKPVLFGRNL